MSKINIDRIRKRYRGGMAPTCPICNGAMNCEHNHMGSGQDRHRCAECNDNRTIRYTTSGDPEVMALCDEYEKLIDRIDSIQGFLI